MKKELEKFGLVIENEDLSKHTTYKIGGTALYMLRPESIDKLVSAIEYLKEKNLKYFILGNGSNLILIEDYYDGVIIKLDLLNNFEISEDLIVTAEAGVYLPRLSSELAKLGYSGFEWASGLPGTIGGSIYGNAEAYKIAISDNLIDVKVFRDKKVINIKKEEIFFSYRTSEFKEKQDTIILSARFKLEKKESSEILELIKERAKKRIETQPLEFPSAGSVFRNPSAKDNYNIVKKYNIPYNESGFISAGYLIEQCGLKGTTIGDAQISEKHANFIINKNNATSNDVIMLINLIKKEVKEKFEIDLFLEQQIVDLKE